MYEKRTAKTAQQNETKTRYFLVSEGTVTEPLYFEALIAHQTALGISPTIELIPLLRSYSEAGFTQPKKLIECLLQNLAEQQQGKISYKTLLDRIMDYLLETKSIQHSKQARKIWNRMVNHCEQILHRPLYIKFDRKRFSAKCHSILFMLQQYIKLPASAKQITTVLIERNLTYRPGVDKLCLFIDRDKEQFGTAPQTKQYNEVIELCHKNNIQLYVSNPCFEFWLLLHFKQIFAMHDTLLLENPKVTSRKRYASHQLSKLLPNGYQKNHYAARKLVKQIDTAIANESAYCENVHHLEYRLGSNVGKFIEHLRQIG